ncbi:type 1 fimbrial major subunit FimA [Enterobacter wuhouensis]|jgi:major type 1 subunit fimbrin (pilin)|uniref:Type 1 fimbrial major subunit FimA n=1 Tax=Enterobacter wuhouensis TaxID=2529381 RepID=A0A4R0GAG3_9ENTR|nr:type 1 fimbrial major subunit FimA [Enterobacter wuhouensis]MCV2534681.1 type 1 fimbrial major subunit FimA [Enterobacter wuhouensis]TCB94010.1 type 1 fimbrial protein subunit FimA [Enterobacter wuhouensis]WRW32646.1 type 1 fimbrial major subunit FimA [Enterobacter wuhouensis]
MKFSNIASTVIASLALVAGAAHAEDTTTPVSVNGGTVHFKGELVNAACSVNTDSSEQTVKLGQYRTAKFTKVGDTTSNIPFTIELNDCDPLVAKTAAVAFTGQIDATDKTLLAVSSGSNDNTAKGVGIEILDSKSSVLTPDGATFSAAQTLIEGTNTLNFTARYKATAATTTPGQANADATFVMKYE